MANELFQKVVDTVAVGAAGGGILSPEQSNRFIDYMWDATSLGQTVRQIRMRAPVREIDKMDLGQRIARHATEAVDDGVNAAPTFSKIQLSTEKIRLDWELSSESLEDNIEESNLEDHIARLMATQLGNDLEDLAINGNDEKTDPLISSFDGYLKRSLVGASVVDWDASGATTIATGLFNQMYKALPRRYKARRRELRFFAGSGLVQDYHQALIALGIASGETFPMVQPGTPGLNPEGNGGLTNLAPFGIPLYEVPMFNETFDLDFSNDGGSTAGNGIGDLDATGNLGYVVLTHPDNHLWGVKREITVHREFAPKKDAIEYTVYTRQGVQIDNLDAYVIGKNVLDDQFA
ncbi:MAG: phage major capsid protein [Actinobacteria bacterium]|nr:phage major capsid protein [Actinomycetota bacterium]